MKRYLVIDAWSAGSARSASQLSDEMNAAFRNAYTFAAAVNNFIIMENLKETGGGVMSGLPGHLPGYKALEREGSKPAGPKSRILQDQEQGHGK